MNRLLFPLLALLLPLMVQSNASAQSTGVYVTSTGSGTNTVIFKYYGTGSQVIDVEWQELVMSGQSWVPTGSVFGDHLDKKYKAPPFGAIYDHHEYTVLGGLSANKMYRFRFMEVVGGVSTQVFPSSGWGQFPTGP